MKAIETHRDRNASTGVSLCFRTFNASLTRASFSAAQKRRMPLFLQRSLSFRLCVTVCVVLVLLAVVFSLFLSQALVFRLYLSTVPLNGISDYPARNTTIKW